MNTIELIECKNDDPNQSFKLSQKHIEKDSMKNPSFSNLSQNFSPDVKKM